MMRWRPFLLIVCVSILIVIGTALANQRHQEARLLRVATAPDYCPYEFIESHNGVNHLMGFDIDLAKAISTELNTPLHFDLMPFNELLLALRSEDADLAIAALTPTDERKKVVSFSRVYHEVKSLIVSTADMEIEDVSDLSGRLIGVRPGTIHDRLAATVPDGERVFFDSTSTLLRAVTSKEIDAAILDAAIARHYLRRRWKVNTLALDNEAPSGVAIGLPKRSPLLGSVNQVLRHMRANGTLEELELKWFDEYVCPREEAA
ncbi:MAG: ABC transporter substrate-binding protein [Leptolyngbyaceae bacterium]|nr:ABC transporter substrate-binding protein [Leptolyngbyaceae bacterium]